MMATARPWLFTSVATRNPDIDATAPTERSMPPVSIVSVWQPARIASGTAARSVTPRNSELNTPGRASSRTLRRIASSPSNGMIGRSRNSRCQAAGVSH
jgi:hypothetical protein